MIPRVHMGSRSNSQKLASGGAIAFSFVRRRPGNCFGDDAVSPMCMLLAICATLIGRTRETWVRISTGILTAALLG